MHVAAARAVDERLLPALHAIHRRLAASRPSDWDRIVKIGRTHLQDATPLTLGQEFSGYAWQIEAGITRVEAALPRAPRSSRRAAPRSAPGSTRPQGFAERFAAEIAKLTRAAVRHRAQQVRGAGERTTRWSSFPARSTSSPSR